MTDRNMKRRKSDGIFLYAFVCCVLAVITMTAAFYVGGYAPFGGKSLAGGDIDISQLDQYGYLKDVIKGKNSFGYTLSLYLGGVTTNVFSYGMMSPLNLVFVFFPKEWYPVVFNLLALIKVGLIAAAMGAYLRGRFERKMDPAVTLILSLGYSFSSYSVAQIVNIFWLDGVIMLPLILLGVYRIISRGKGTLFALSICVSLILNWYSGAINCIFCVFWFLLETALYSERPLADRKWVALSIGRALLYGAIGILLSCAVLLPTFQAIGKGNRGNLDLGSIFDGYIGNLLTPLTNYGIGLQASQSRVSLFCGSLSMLGCAAFLMDGRVERRKRTIIGVFLIFLCLAFCWQPLVMLFSMLKRATSFWFRYSYIGSFALIFIAACFFYDTRNREHPARPLLLYGLLIWGGVFLLANLEATGSRLKAVNATVLFAAAILAVYILYRDRKVSGSMKTALRVVLIGLSAAEMGMNAVLLMDSYDVDNYIADKEYIHAQEIQITELKEYDPGDYRITQTLTRKMKPFENTAHYDEPMGFGYWSLTGYTNSPDDRQRSFLDRVGYRKNGENYYIVNSSILGIDSLLGVKYLLSPYDVNGYEAVEDLNEHNTKKVYVNPNAMPMAFLCAPDLSLLEGEYRNPFEYQNRIYSALLNRETELYTSVDYSVTEEQDTLRTYDVTLPEGDIALYVNFPWDRAAAETVIADGQKVASPYSEWGSSSVIYIPTEKGQRKVTLSVTSEKRLSIKEAQIYVLHLDRLKEAVEALNAEPVVEGKIENASAEFRLELAKPRDLFVSIAYDEGWEITDNGKKTEPKLFENCLMLLPLEAGSHHIEMRYHIPGVKTGIILSLAGAALLAATWIAGKRRKRN